MPEQMPAFTTSENDEGFLNVTDTVGRNSVNKPNDVLLVQAMLHIIMPYTYSIPQESLTYPSGTYDSRTATAILKYQEASSKSRRVKIWKDGFINRAVGAHVPGKKRVWTITYMNEDLYYAYLVYGYGRNYSEWLYSEYPQLLEYSAYY